MALPIERNTEPTAIGKMWLERKALRCKFDAANRVRDSLHEEPERRMPKPDPSIVCVEANNHDVYGWKASHSAKPLSEPYTLHQYLEPRLIERRLEEITPNPAKRVDREDGGIRD